VVFIGYKPTTIGYISTTIVVFIGYTPTTEG
jgi:hypothetical protein